LPFRFTGHFFQIDMRTFGLLHFFPHEPDQLAFDPLKRGEFYKTIDPDKFNTLQLRAFGHIITKA